MSKEPRLVCWMCGEEHTQETKHKDWCERVTRKIYNDFNSTFKEIYSVLELSLEDKKLEIAKSLIGNKIMEARNKAIERVINYHFKDQQIVIDKNFKEIETVE